MVSPSVFGIFFFFFKKKTLNWTRDTKLDNNQNLIQNLIVFSLSFDFNYIYIYIQTGYWAVRCTLFFGMIFFGKYYDWRTFFWEKNFFHFYVVILKNTMKGFMINFVNFMKYIYRTHRHVDLSTNIKFRHILAQEGYANNIKAINHVISKETCQKDMLLNNNMQRK